MRTALLAAIALLVPASLAQAQTNVSPAKKFAWGENIGWLNWRDANSGTQGVKVCPAHLRGYIWAENVGWINTGNGPAVGTMYSNASGLDFGVNIAVNGDLSGFAWGENIGWINFSTPSVAPLQAHYNASNNTFEGYAWGENVGWVNLDDSVHFVCAIIGNVNADGAGVDTADLGLLIGQFGGAGPGGDVNCDGVVDTADLGLLLSKFGASCPP